MKNRYLHLIHIILFAAITFFYSWPIIDGNLVKSPDIDQFKGMSQEIKEYREDTGNEALWTNSMFSGMPTYHMGVKYPNNILLPIDKLLQLGFPRPIGSIFVCFLGFYILLLTLKFDLKISFLGALAFGLSTYLYIIIAAGHNTKLHAIAYMAPTIAAMIYCYRDRRLLGFLLTFLFLGLQIRANHYQITYYLLFLLFAFFLFELISSLRKKEVKNFFKNTIVFALGCFFAILINIASLWSTYEYSKYSIRGGSEINLEDKQTNQDGLDFEKVTQWSYGKLETFNLMVPNLYGGTSFSSELTENSNYYDELINLKNAGYLDVYSELTGKKSEEYISDKMSSIRMYWGEQPMTQGPVYIGSIIIFLFLLGFLIIHYKKKENKNYFILGWILFALIILSVFLSWGSNFWLTKYFFNYFPMYSKFRSITMILVIVEIAIPILAIIGLSKLLENDSSLINIRKKKIYLFSSFFIFSIICLLLYSSIHKKKFLSSTEIKAVEQIDIDQYEEYSSQLEEELNYLSENYLNFSPNERIQIEQQYPLIYNELYNVNQSIIDYRLIEPSLEDRSSLFNKDLGRSFIFVLLVFILLNLFLLNKINRNIVIYLITGLIIMDMWFVNKRYFNKDNFVNKVNYEKPFEEDGNYKKIKKDKSKHYRVLDYKNPQEKVSYFHKNILGKHAAGLSRYNDIIDNIFYKEFTDNNEALSSLGGCKIVEQLGCNFVYDSIPLGKLCPNYCNSQDEVINMLNVNWINGQKNPSSLGNSWFVDNIKYASSPQEEFDYLLDYNFSAQSTAILNNKDKSHISQSNYISNQLDTIYLTKYTPNELHYKSKTETVRLAVFSEVYYPKGWTAYIDGKKVSHFCVNYILRALEVPKGEHTITFKFEPNSFHVGNNIALASSIIFVLTFISLFFPYFRRKFLLLKK